MSFADDVTEVLAYAVMNTNEFEGEDWADTVLAASRRLYDKAVKDEATLKVDSQLRKIEKRLLAEGKMIANRADFRKEQIAVMLTAFKSFDEWRSQF